MSLWLWPMVAVAFCAVWVGDWMLVAVTAMLAGCVWDDTDRDLE